MKTLRFPLATYSLLSALVFNLTPANASAQSVVPGYFLETWAPVSDPVDLSAAQDGSIYVGRDLSGSGGVFDAPTRIHRIAPDRSVSEYGPEIDDPDVVLFDLSGTVGPAGAVLVGGSEATGGPPERGFIVYVDTQQQVTDVYGPSSDLLNPSGLAIDLSGDLLVSDFNNNRVRRLHAGTLEEVITGLVSALDVAVHPLSGDLYVSWADNVVRVYSSTGTLIDNSFASGRAIAFDPQTSPPDLYTVNNSTGDLLRVAPDGSATVVGAGFTTVWGMDFGADGSLYIGEFANDRVLRVWRSTQVPTLNSVATAPLVLILVFIASVTLPRYRPR